MLIHYRGKEAWFAEGEYPVESDQYLLKMVIEALPEAPPPEIRIDDVAYWTRTWMDESSVEYMMNVQGPTFAECLEVARSAETMTMKSVNPKGRASTSAKRARKTVKVDLHFYRDARGAIHLFGKNGGTKLFVSTVDPRPDSVRHHPHLYAHLDRLLRTRIDRS